MAKFVGLLCRNADGEYFTASVNPEHVVSIVDLPSGAQLSLVNGTMLWTYLDRPLVTLELSP